MPRPTRPGTPAPLTAPALRRALIAGARSLIADRDLLNRSNGHRRRRRAP